LKVDARTVDGAVVLALSGEITSREDQQDLLQTIATELEAGSRTFVLDLSLVPYCSSLGIATFTGAYTRVQREGGTVRLVNPRPKVSKVLEMTKVADVFATYGSVEEALRAE
jgi:anti-sigma B factor antagonist